MSNDQVSKTSKNRVECIVTFDEAEVAPAEAAALTRLGSNVKVKGFRPGNVPTDVAKDQVDPGQLMEETIRELLPATFERLVKEHEIQPIVSPKVEAQNVSPLTLKITFCEKPEVKLKGVGKIKIEKKEPKYDEKDVQQMIDYVLKQHQKTQVVERPAKEGDQVTMDFWGAGEDGNEIPEIRSEGYKVIIGSKTLLPGFEDNLKDKKAGDETSFVITFPEKYHAEHLQNKPVTFHVTVKQIEEVKLPELTDEFAKKELSAESADAFKKQIEDSMRKQEEDVEQKRREQVAMDNIREATQVDLAEELIEDETRALIEELDQQLSKQGMTIKEWLDTSGKKPEELQKEMMENAQKRLTLRLGMQALVEEKNVEISEEEMKEIIDEFLAPLSADERLQVAASYAPGQHAYEQLKWQKKVEKVLDELLS